MNKTSQEADRDAGLGAVLRAAVEASLGSSAADRRVSWPARARGRNRAALASAAAVLIASAGAVLGVGVASGREEVRDAALALAESVLPERSAWVVEAISEAHSDGLAQSEIHMFVESLWTATDSF